MDVGKIRRNVLVIAYYFPPLGLSGVQRTLKFVKYLPEYGWQPTVLTVGNVGFYAKDNSLLEELEGKGIRIIRTHTRDPLRLFHKKDVVSIPRESVRSFATSLSQTFLQPDNKIGWKKYALGAVDDLMQESDHPAFDAIFATAPPYTDFLIGAELKRKYRIPLVIDYRDAWVGNPRNFYATPFHRAYAARSEEQVLRESNNIIVVQRKIKEQLIRRYPFIGFDDVRIISHGYDQSDFDAARTRAANVPDTSKMRFTYSGIFYENCSPKYFLEALALVFARHPETKNNIEACFVGHFRKEHLKIIKRLNLSDAVLLTGYLPHVESVQMLLRSDVLWEIVFSAMYTPGKIFEYIGARKPVIACVPEGVVAQIMRDYGAAQVTAPADVEAIASAIHNYYLLWKQGKLPVPSESFVKEFERRLLTQELAKTLEAVAPL